MSREALTDAVRRIHWDLVAHLRGPLAREPLANLSATAGESAGDTLYGLDRHIEGPLVAALEKELAGLGRFLVVAEGMGETERMILPSAAGPGAIDGTLIIDPIDGTRGLMYGKRSAWILTGFAPAGVRDREPVLENLELAVQTEIPTARSHLADQLWARRGGGIRALTRNLESGAERAFVPAPSAALSIRGGFAMLVRYFPPDRELIARLDDLLIERVLGPASGRAQVFEDQYLSTAGMLYDLIMGKNRFVADIRSLVYSARERRGLGRGHDAHPYDLATALVAREAGVIVGAVDRPDLPFALDTTTPVRWAGYANAAIRDEVEPHLMALLAEAGLIPPRSSAAPE